MSTATLGYIGLPDHWQGSADDRKAVYRLLSSRLDYEIELDFQTKAAPFRAYIREAPQFPDKIPFATMREEFEACKPGEIIIGRTASGRTYRGSFLTDDPHWGFSVGSRRGKSTFLSLTAAQILHQDPLAGVTGIDVKRESFKSLIGVPGLTLANDPRNIEEMWTRIAEFRQEMDDRCDARAEDPTLTFPFRVLMLDEANQFSAQSTALWRKLKEQGDPAHPPCWDDIAAVFWQGAAFRCHVIIVGQRLDDRVTGGIGLNTSLGLRGLAGFRPRDWDRLIGTYPVPRSRKERGRWIYSDGEDETWVQNVWATDEEIRDYALEGRRRATGPNADPQQWVTGLDAAAGHLGLSVEAFRKRRQRSPVPGEQRRGNQPSWPVDELNAWAPDTQEAMSA